MKVSDLMTSDVLTCRPGDSAERAARLMWDGDCGSVPVVSSTGQVVGMVTDRDLCMAALHQGTRLPDLRVESAMSRDMVTLSPDDDVRRAAEAMRERRVRRLPVVEPSGRLVGVVSLSDLALARHGKAAKRTGAPTATDLAATLAALGEPSKPRQARATN